MSIKYVQSNTLYQAGAGNIIGATSVVLTSLTDIYANVLTMTDFGVKGYITLEPDTTNEEGATFTGITANANNTYTLTGVSTILAKSPYTETSGLVRNHAGGTKVVITDNVAFWNTFANKANDETITGRWGTATVPASGNDITNKTYVDSVATGGATFNQQIIAGVAGENLTSGNVVYLKASDGKWYVADSATASKSVGIQLGIAQATVLSAATVNILTAGLDQKQTGLTAGSVYYLGVTGAISTTPGANIRLVGQVPNGSTTNLVVNFASGDPTIMLTDGSRTYVADTGAANAYAITLVPAITAYKTGQVFSFKAANANTTASTLAVNGLTATSIKKNSASALIANDILAGQLVMVEYDGTNFQMLSQVGNAQVTPKFGGTGADGALTVTSGTTTIDLGSAAVVTKNYTSISITGTGSIAFINPAAGGTLIRLLSQGNVTLTSSATPMIDASGMGAASATTANASLFVVDTTSHTGGVGQAGQSGTGSTGGTAGSAYTSPTGLYIRDANQLNRRAIFLTPGSGGAVGGAGRSGGTGGAGGRGGGALYIECAGAWNFTTASGISISGLIGGTGSAGTNAIGGGGGGGSVGSLLVLYTTLTANSGTVTAAGGTGGTGGQGTDGSGSAGAGGGGAGAFGAGGVGGAGTSGGAGNVGNAGTTGGGGGGGSGTANNAAGNAGGAGATDASAAVITQNLWFI